MKRAELILCAVGLVVSYGWFRFVAPSVDANGRYSRAFDNDTVGAILSGWVLIFIAIGFVMFLFRRRNRK